MNLLTELEININRSAIQIMKEIKDGKIEVTDTPCICEYCGDISYWDCETIDVECIECKKNSVISIIKLYEMENKDVD